MVETEYKDDDAYAEAVSSFIEGIDGMLQAGGTPEDVRAEFEALMKGRE